MADALVRMWIVGMNGRRTRTMVMVRRRGVKRIKGPLG